MLTDINETVTKLSNWIAEIQEQLDGLVGVVAKLSKQDSTTSDPFNDAFPAGPVPVSPEPIETKPTPTALMEQVWAMELGGKMDFLDGFIEMIRKPETYPPLNYHGMLVTDPGCIKITHPNIDGGFQPLSLRGQWDVLSSRFPEIGIWFRKETGVSVWGRQYRGVWGIVESHQRKTLYNIDTGLTHAYGEWTCAEAKPQSRILDAPDYATLREIWIS